MNSRQRFKLGAGAGLVTMLLGALMVLAPGAVGASHDGFAGECSGTETSGTCVIDEPEGHEAATHGTVTYTRDDAADTITFAIDVEPDSVVITQIQVCMTVATSADSPYTPTNANSCAGANTSGTQNVLDVSGDAIQNPFTIDLNAVTGYDAGADSPLFWALHININDDGAQRTTYVVGPGQPTTQPVFGEFTIDKVLDGDLPEGVDGDTPFTFSIACADGEDDPINLNGDLEGDATTVTVTADDPAVWSSDSLGVPLPAGSSCVVGEVDPAGDPDVTYTIDGVDEPVSGGTITVDLDDAVAVAVVATNDYGQDGPGTGGFTVNKDLAGTAVPDGETYNFTVECEDAEGEPWNFTEESTELTFGLLATDAPYPVTGLPVGAECTITEDASGATSTTVTVGDVVTSGRSAGLTIAEGVTQTVLVVNSYTTTGGGGGTPVVIPDVEEPASLTVTKLVIGPPIARPTTWEQKIDIDGFGTANDETVELTQDARSATRSSLPAGEYTLDELGVDAADGTMELADIRCVDANADADSAFAVETDLRDGVVVSLDEGSDVTCTFVNRYALVEVLPTPPVVNPPVVTPPTPPGPPAVVPVAQPAPQVKGDVVTRTLPRTGDETRGLAGVGAFMLALGAVMVLGSRRQLARR